MYYRDSEHAKKFCIGLCLKNCKYGSDAKLWDYVWEFSDALIIQLETNLLIAFLYRWI